MNRYGFTLRVVSDFITACAILALGLALSFATGCGSTLPSTVSITSVATSVSTNGTVTLTAKTASGGVVWALYGTNCYGVTCGSLANATSTTVQYTAPATLSGSSLSVTIQATSVINSLEQATFTLTVAPVGVTITPPSSTTVADGASLNLAASVTNDVNSAGVTWSLSGTGCSGTACGTLTNSTATSVTYTAPATPSAALYVVITATSVADPSISTSLTLSVPIVIVTITPPVSTTVKPGATLALTAATANDPANGGVTWSLTGTGCTGTACGTLTGNTKTSVTYVAPMQPPAGQLTVTITATSITNPAASTLIVLTVPPAIVTITPPASTTLKGGSNLTLAATVTNDVNNAGVTWTLSGVGCTGTTCGTLTGNTTTAVTYTAPATASGTLLVTITATSVSNPALSNSVTLTVLPIAVTIAPPSSTTVKAGASLPLSATVSNDTNSAGVTWSLTGTGCTGTACGTLTGSTTTSTTYVGPAQPPASSFTITITATSVADSGSSTSVTLTVPAISVAITPPANTTVQAGATVALTATVANDLNSDGVAWTLTGTGCTGTACGTLTNITTTSVTYNAPAKPANALAVTITATSVANTTVLATQALTVPTAPVVITLNPSTTTTVADNSTQVITATVANDINSDGITWSLTGTGCTGTACGTLTSSSTTQVTYNSPTAPSTAFTVTITATSIAQTSSSTSVTLSISAAPPITVAIAPPTTTSFGPSGTVNLTASVTNDVNSDGVTWSLSGTGCTGATCGTLTNITTTSATYTAPATITTQQTVTVTATSVANTSDTNTLILTDLLPVTFSPAVLPVGTVGVAYSTTITVSGGTPPYTIATPTNLPSWATAGTTVNNTTGIITIAGTPTGAYKTSGTGATAFQYGNPTILGTGTPLIGLSATDSTVGTPLTGTASVPLTMYNTTSNPAPNASTITNSMMKGSYAFYGSGYTENSAETIAASELLRVSYIGSIVADGNGNITGGEIDVNNPAGFASYKGVTGSYSVQSNQIATITILLPTSPVTPVTLVAALGDLNSSSVATAGQFIEYDDVNGITAGTTPGTRVTGELALQAASVLSTTTTPISGPFAFGMAGGNPAVAITSTCETALTCGPTDAAGAITFSGAVSTGEEDIAVGSTSTTQVTLAGTLGNSGNTDAFGRVTATLTAGNSTLVDWPVDYVIYAVGPLFATPSSSPATFYIMSADPFIATTLMSGKAEAQNLAHIQATPFSSTMPLVLYGNAYGQESVAVPQNSSALAITGLLSTTPTSGSTTAGTIAGTIKSNGNTTGTNLFTTSTISSSSPMSYLVEPATGRVTLSGGTFTATYTNGTTNENSNPTGYPELYLVDTSQGFAVTQPNTTGIVPTGTLQLLPQSSLALNAGNFTSSVYKSVTTQAVTQVGIFTFPAGGVPNTNTKIAFTGQLFGSYSKTSNNESNAANTNLFDATITSGTITDAVAGGVLSGISITGGFEACAGGGGGYVISTNQFVCFSGGSVSFQQMLYFQQ